MTSGERPTLSKVDLIEWKDGSEVQRFRLIDLIIGNCEEISIQLNILKTVYDGWVIQRLGRQSGVCHDVLQHWLQSGTGPHPITWKGLIEVLIDVQLGEVAIQLKTALLNKIQD